MIRVILASFLLAGVARCYNYDEVLRLSLMFYEAQRSGHLPANNRIPWRADSATTDKGQNGEDLSGGYYDGNFTTTVTITAKRFRFQ
jgi:hypothetical protein